MRPYLINFSPDGESREVDVVLTGPGLQQDGKRYRFANEARCSSFVEAVNFAYEQGLRDGARGRRPDRRNGSRLLVVAGRTPEELHLRREGLIEWVIRSLRRHS